MHSAEVERLQDGAKMFRAVQEMTRKPASKLRIQDDSRRVICNAAELNERVTHHFGQQFNDKKKGMVLYSAVSSPLDRSKRFTLSSPGRPFRSDTVLGFSWKHSSHAAIAQRLFTHIYTTVYSQVLILYS